MNTLRYTSILAFLTGGGTLVLIRHGNTAPAETDLERQLTPMGEQMAINMREYVIHHYNVVRVAASPAQRVLSTVSDERWPTPEPLPPLYPAPHYGIDPHFNALKYSSLIEYYKREGAQNALEGWAHDALTVLDAYVALGPLTQSSTIVVGGHAVCLNQMATMLGKELGATPFELEAATHTVLDECGYLEISVVDGRPNIACWSRSAMEAFGKTGT